MTDEPAAGVDYLIPITFTTLLRKRKIVSLFMRIQNHSLAVRWDIPMFLGGAWELENRGER